MNVHVQGVPTIRSGHPVPVRDELMTKTNLKDPEGV